MKTSGDTGISWFLRKWENCRIYSEEILLMLEKE
jgi:hypothetical protein